MRPYWIVWLLCALVGCAWERGSAYHVDVRAGDPLEFTAAREAALGAAQEVADEFGLALEDERELGSMRSSPGRMWFWANSPDSPVRIAGFSLFAYQTDEEREPLILCVRMWNAEWFDDEAHEPGRVLMLRLCDVLERRGLKRMESETDETTGYFVLRDRALSTGLQNRSVR